MSNVQEFKQQLGMQQWSSIIEDRIASGLKIDEYCDKNGLSRNSYYYWLRKIREDIASSSSTNDKLLPTTTKQGALVELVPNKSNTPVPRIELQPEAAESIALAINGISICVSTDISEEMLTKVMRAACNA